MVNKKEIIEKLEKRKEKLREKGVKKIGLFGSYLKGKQKRGSDIDLLVEVSPEKQEDYFELLFYLEKILKRKIDLIIESDLRPKLNYVKEEAEYVKL